jgi:hypothetical protein
LSKFLNRKVKAFSKDKRLADFPANLLVSEALAADFLMLINS